MGSSAQDTRCVHQASYPLSLCVKLEGADTVLGFLMFLGLCQLPVIVSLTRGLFPELKDNPVTDITHWKPQNGAVLRSSPEPVTLRGALACLAGAVPRPAFACFLVFLSPKSRRWSLCDGQLTNALSIGRLPRWVSSVL